MCYYCGEPAPSDRKPGFSEICPTCGKDMHVCAMCSFYLPGAHWDCRETIETQVTDKMKRNFCDWFELAPRFLKAGEGRKDERSKAQSAKSAFDSLFGS